MKKEKKEKKKGKEKEKAKSFSLGGMRISSLVLKRNKQELEYWIYSFTHVQKQKLYLYKEAQKKEERIIKFTKRIRRIKKEKEECEKIQKRILKNFYLTFYALHKII